MALDYLVVFVDKNTNFNSDCVNGVGAVCAQKTSKFFIS
jgi:hypothetical protein